MANDKEKILQMVADGTITVEEANRLLECLDIIVETGREQAEPAAGTAANAVADAVTEAKPETPEPVAEVKQQAQAPAAPEPPTPPVEPTPEPPKTEQAAQPVGNTNETKTETTYTSTGSSSYSGAGSATAIRGFQISWISGSIDIRRYGGDEINITEYSKYEIDEEDKMEIIEDNGILKIKWDKRGGIFSFSSLTRLITKPFFSKQLVIEIPEAIADNLEKLNCSSVSSKVTVSGLQAEHIDLSSTSGGVELYDIRAQLLKSGSVSGKVTLQGVSTGSLNIDSTSGTVDASDFSAGSARFETVSGSLNLEGGANELKCNTVSGKINADLANCPAKVNCETVSGAINLYIPDNEGFRLRYSGLSGKMSTDFPASISGKSDSGTATYGNGKSDFKFGTVSGKMNVYRKNY